MGKVGTRKTMMAVGYLLMFEIVVVVTLSGSI